MYYNITYIYNIHIIYNLYIYIYNLYINNLYMYIYNIYIYIFTELVSGGCPDGLMFGPCRGNRSNRWKTSGCEDSGSPPSQRCACPFWVVLLVMVNHDG
jgi:hypothetical protein